MPGENNRRPNIQIFIECLDLLYADFIRRFSTENIVLWEAIFSRHEYIKLIVINS